jgi:hypothetical protein
MKRRNVIATILLAAVCAAGTSLASAPQGQSLIVVDTPRGAVEEILTADGVMIVRDMGSWLIAVADPDGQGRLRRLGVSFTVADESIAGKTYYTVFPTPLRAAAATTGPVDINHYGRILGRRGAVTLVESPPDVAETLPMAGFDIVRVFIRPIRRPQPAAEWASPMAPMQADPLIQTMADAVSGASIDAYVQRLQDFVTRWAIHDSCQAAADWIKSEFESFGLDSVYFQNFHASFKDNVVAVHPGVTTPEQFVIIGGHYDSVSNVGYVAPGADDNASGTACVLECARILSQYSFDRTVVFIAFGAEEQGLLGSEYYAAQAAANGDQIMGMINVDMIGYLAPGDDIDIDVVTNSFSTGLRDRAINVASTYVPGFPAVNGHIPYGSGSDHQSFWDLGYRAIMFFEDTDEYSPYIHTVADSIGLSYNCPFLAENSTRVAAALLADLAGPHAGPSIADTNPPSALVLDQNVPNPFNPRTMIRFEVPPPGGSASLAVYDVAGRKVIDLLDGQFVNGSRTVWWNGRSERGDMLASGVYFYRLTVGAATSTRKMILLR